MGTESIPDFWKTAYILPLHKGGQSNVLNNYHPISKLSCLSKVLEKLVNDQVRTFVLQHSFLNSYQSGFRPGHSTMTAASKVLNDFASALDNKQVCLELIGFDGKSCNWFSNYLSGRTQAVVADGYQSSFMSVNKGVSQGSILGPLLFTIFINELGANVRNCTIHLYADDAIIYTTVPSVAHVVQNLHFDFFFCAVQQTLIDLKLLLNMDKTKCMLEN